MFDGIRSYSFLGIGYLFEMGVALDTFTGVVEDGSGFGVVDEIADHAHPAKPCAVLGAAASGCLVQGQGHLRLSGSCMDVKERHVRSHNLYSWLICRKIKTRSWRIGTEVEGRTLPESV